MKDEKWDVILKIFLSVEKVVRIFLQQTGGWMRNNLKKFLKFWLFRRQMIFLRLRNDCEVHFIIAWFIH